MPTARLMPLEPVPGRRPLRRLAAGAALLGGLLLPSGPLGFALAPGRGASNSVAAQPGAAGRAAAPRTQMRGRYAEGDRSRKNNQGGGRLPIRVTRKPVLAYSEGDTNEPGNSVLRRMWDMYDQDYNKMAGERQRYFRDEQQTRLWERNTRFRGWRREKKRSIGRKQEELWLDWMRREGRKEGYTEPIHYTGPPLKLTPEEDEATNPSTVKKFFASDEFVKTKFLPSMPKGKDRVPPDMYPGKWNTDGPDNIHRIWRRPLCKWPYDIGKRGKRGPVVHGLVMGARGTDFMHEMDLS